MARAHANTTAPSKKRPRSATSARTKPAPAAHPKKRSPEAPAAGRAARKPAQGASPPKPARRAVPERALVAAPRSTERSAFAEPPPAPRKPARGAAPAPKHRARNSPLAASVGAIEPSGELHGLARGPGDARNVEGSGRVMELHWGDDTPSSRRPDGVVQRWIKRGDALLRHLAEHGAARHEYRADLKDGRFVWIGPDGRVSAEARVQVLCSWSPTTSALTMAWADPLVRAAGVSRLDGLPSERDDIDEEAAWRVAMQSADRARADYLYRVTTPHAWYFLALTALTFDPARATFRPSTPVGLVLRGLVETRRAVESRAEPTEVLRERLLGLGRALLLDADYAYRGTDWVARLERAGRRLVHLAEQLPRASFTSIAAGRIAGEWLGRKETIDLCEALELLEDEWSLFL